VALVLRKQDLVAIDLHCHNGPVNADNPAKQSAMRWTARGSAAVVLLVGHATAETEEFCKKFLTYMEF
jgi:hypothetical protein